MKKKPNSTTAPPRLRLGLWEDPDPLRSFWVRNGFERGVRSPPLTALRRQVRRRWRTGGKTYLDACSGAIVANLGHGLPAINDAITGQLQKVAFAHTSQFVSEAGLELAKKVVELTPAGFKKGARAYFMSGGSEAVETAVQNGAQLFFVHQR